MGGRREEEEQILGRAGSQTRGEEAAGGVSNEWVLLHQRNRRESNDMRRIVQWRRKDP